MDKETRLKVAFEISQIDILLKETKPLLELPRAKIPDMIKTAALGLFLHSFYNGVENTIKFIIKDEDKNLPSSYRWHKELLDVCFVKTERRNEILPLELKPTLDDYLSFRHFIRNTYSFRIKWERMEHLILNVHENWRKIKTAFTDYMDSIP